MAAPPAEQAGGTGVSHWLNTHHGLVALIVGVAAIVAAIVIAIAAT